MLDQIDGTVDDLRLGDALHTIGPVAMTGPGGMFEPVMVTGTPVAGEMSVQVPTTAAILTAESGTAVVYSRTTEAAVLMVTRSDAHYSQVLAALGVPVVRCSPATGDSAPLPTNDQWEAAALVIVDGHLRSSTIADMWEHVSFDPADKTVVLGIEHPSVVTYEKARLTGATVAVPFGHSSLRTVFERVMSDEGDGA